MQLAAQPCTTVDTRQSSVRQWVGAGAALATAGAIVAAPGINPVLPTLEHRVETAAVRLSAGWDPLAAWRDAFETASGNASTLTNNFLLAPGVGLQQAIVNQVGYLRELLNDPSSIGDVLGKIANDVSTVGSGVTGVNASDAIFNAAIAHTVDGIHGVMLGLLPQFLSPNVDAGLVTSLLKVAASPLSGVLMGAVGPVVSPVVAFLNSVTAIVSALQVGDTTTAFQELVDAPARVVGSFFNGATLDVSALTPLLNSSGLFQNTTLNSLDIAFGGLLSTGSVSVGPYNGPSGSISVPGGSIFNSVGMNVTATIAGLPITLPIAGNAIGPLGALEGLSQTIGVLLGDGWDGKGASQLPPLAGLNLSSSIATADSATTTAAALTATADAATSDVTTTSTESTVAAQAKTAAANTASKQASTTSTEQTATSQDSTTSPTTTSATDTATSTPTSTTPNSTTPTSTTPTSTTSTKGATSDGAESEATTSATETTSGAKGSTTNASAKDSTTGTSKPSSSSTSTGTQTGATKSGTSESASAGVSSSGSTAGAHGSSSSNKSGSASGGGDE
ncbi:outer membrane porin GjpA [Mycolicibacterium sp. 050158]|uniref:outer membrane porin GjpA n=1 Tax=Mycolicibacterium sp. 050158 TaxID=3090602 RepID=UPI00299D1995|nr:outer membrane porin GjpA [Mycolicibacterium sp. 050158]MDX1889742.1 outer membrane porin GjpA [Mycolicibacterium sp. 050158]